jgi:hypothetical protein
VRHVRCAEQGIKSGEAKAYTRIAGACVRARAHACVWLGTGGPSWPNQPCPPPRRQPTPRCIPHAPRRDADESRPAEAFTTERAVRAGRANAASGRIMVNVPNDHFGPILPEHDPTNGKVGLPALRWLRATTCAAQ